MSAKGAIITGAASGIGVALTKDLLSKGWRVVMADINRSGEAIGQSLGANTLFVHTGTSDWGSQVELFRKGTVFDWCPSISVLAANAGVTDSTFLPTFTAPDATSPPQKPNLQTIHVNLLGTIYSIQLFLHHFTRQTPPSPKGLHHNHRLRRRALRPTPRPHLLRQQARRQPSPLPLPPSSSPFLSRHNTSITIPAHRPNALPGPHPPRPARHNHQRDPTRLRRDGHQGAARGHHASRVQDPALDRRRDADGADDRRCNGPDGRDLGAEDVGEEAEEYPDEVARWVWEDAPGVWQRAWEESQGGKK